MPYQSQAVAVLVRWRVVERAMLDAVPGSPEADVLQVEAARLRNEYQALIDAARAHEAPMPPPFPKHSGSEP
jgi:hypothetical protein